MDVSRYSYFILSTRPGFWYHHTPLPKDIRRDLTRDNEIEVSDWVKQSLEKATRLVVHPHEERLANILIEHAYDVTRANTYSFETALAAAFDLFVTAEYYKSIAHKGWYFCPLHEPLLFYPFTNTCPRCVLQAQFHYEKANKPESGQIGQATSRLLSVFLCQLFIKTNRNLNVYRGVEPVDMVIYDKQENTVLLSEIKAAPLVTLPLATSSEYLTDLVEGRVTNILSHVSSDNISLSTSEISMFLPSKQQDKIVYKLISLGKTNVQADKTWAYERIEQVLHDDDTLFSTYLDFWIEAFNAYSTGNRVKSNYFWFTNACGQPSPRPLDWPARQKGEGYESISDGKTSVGMDRTDDIKKGIYQVLKVGAESKPQKSKFQVKTALISNIHAVRHYNEYLTSLENVVWTVDKTQNAKKAGDLPPETEIYNLFDGIVSFTKSHIRDEWIERNFHFQS